MIKKFAIEYQEWISKEKANIFETYYLEQDIYKKLTLRDVKEFIKEQRYKIHKPVCTCMLEIWGYESIEKRIIYPCYKQYNFYKDSTFLDNTYFNESNPIVVIPGLNRSCTCGLLDKLKICCFYEEQKEKDIKRWEEKERKDKEYFNRIYQEEKKSHKEEIKRLKNLIVQQNNENQKQIVNQQNIYKLEIDRMKSENNRRLNEFNEERIENNKRFQNLQYERNQEKIENKTKLDNMEKERFREREENQKKFDFMENERNREREENQKKFANIEKERERERESYSRRFNSLEKTLRDKERQLQINTQKLEENENQRKFKEKCEKEAEKKFLDENHKISREYFLKNKEVVAKEIISKMKELNNQYIGLDEIDDNFIFNIVKNEKFIKNVIEFLDDKFTYLNDDNININISSCNIIILGNTGVGKSTLLNTVLKENLAETAFGDACTMGIPKPYESEKAKGIRIWDSRGIENGKYNLETAFKDIRNTIDCLIKKNDPDKFIHCIWYCIRSNRFTEEEAENLINCYNSYIEKLPIIVVFTQSENQKITDKMMEKVKFKLENSKRANGFNEKEVNDIKILKVLAQNYEHDFGEVKSFGIHNLMEQTSEIAKIGIQRAYTHSLMEIGKNMLKEEFLGIIKKTKEKIYTKKNNNEIQQSNNININNITKI